MEKNAEVLNDLIKINHDRIKGYEKAAAETKDTDADLRSLFNDMASESKGYAAELEGYVSASGKSPADDSTIYGDIYRAWMDVKATFTGKDRKAILASCEFGEDAAQRAYDMTLSSDAQLPADTYSLITDQKSSLRKSHDKIKRMRDTQPA